MAVRDRVISESSKRRIIDASREIVNDALKDGSSKSDALKYIRRLVFRANK